MQAPYENFSFSPLCVAVKEGHIDIINSLLKIDGIKKKHALYVAALLKKEKIFETLLDTYSMDEDLIEIKEVRDACGFFENTFQDRIDQLLKVKKCIKEAETINDVDPINIQLAKIFWSYANPPILSINYRHSHLKMLAENISIGLKQREDWKFSDCLIYIESEIANNCENKESINSLGTFRGLLNLLEKIKAMVPASQDNFIATINRK